MLKTGRGIILDGFLNPLLDANSDKPVQGIGLWIAGREFEVAQFNLDMFDFTGVSERFVVLAAASSKFPKIQKIHVVATAAREYPDPTIPDRVSLGDADHSWSDSQVPSGLIR